MGDWHNVGAKKPADFGLGNAGVVGSRVGWQQGVICASLNDPCQALRPEPAKSKSQLPDTYRPPKKNSTVVYLSGLGATLNDAYRLSNYCLH
jgi:hypothetical protein